MTLPALLSYRHDLVVVSGSSTRSGGLGRALRVEWRELGGLGRIALVGLVLSAAIAVTLGFAIPALVKGHVIDERTHSLSNVLEELQTRSMVPFEDHSSTSLQAIDSAVTARLLGGETLRVKIWSPEGRILYSDAEPLVGRVFELSDERAAAFRGETAVGFPDLTAEENQFERGLGELMDFYLPVMAEDGQVVNVFEVYQETEHVLAVVDDVRRLTWLSIGIGLGILAAFMGAVTVANARIVTRKQHQAEALFRDLSHAQDEERRRIVGSLHDEIGQPLYRVLYGLQGSRARLRDDGPVSEELSRLEDLVRTMDNTLRVELKMLRFESPEELGLGVALSELAETTRAETGMEVALRIDESDGLPVVARSALFKAAQEAVTNARKHAGASAIDVRVTSGNHRVILDVEDNGRGVREPEGLGLTTTRERLEAIGGGLRIRRRDGSGTLFRAWVPMDRRDGP